MKLRAPRCSEPMFFTSLPACQWLQSEAPSAPDSAARAAPEAHRSALNSSSLVRMEDHSVRHRLHAIDAGIDGHEPEEREVQDAEDPRQQHVRAFGRLQAEVAERDERDG